MKYDFDQIIERRGTYSIKYDMPGRGKAADVLPLWVADMDFKAPPCVEEALLRHCRHNIYGYSKADDAYFAVLQNWFSRRHGWPIEPEWLIMEPVGEKGW